MKTLRSNSQRHACSVKTPLGDMFLLASEQGLAGAWFVGQQHFPAEAELKSWQWSDACGHPLLEQAQDQLQHYFSGRPDGVFDLPLDLRQGTAFQQQVWRTLQEIRPGLTSSYGELALSLGKPGGARAVGLAVGRNPISVFVPCHRVLGKNGSLTGYAGGLDRKRYLLNLESGSN